MEEKIINKANKPIFEGNAKSCNIINSIIKKIDIPKDYEFVGIDNNKIVLITKQLQYPKDYKECCEVIGYKLCRTIIIGYKSNVLKTLQELLVCRNAYWKIAGKEMGLGKPWEPNYNDNNIKYIIGVHRNHLDFDATIERNYVLIFPTEKIRNMFYMNFKELINRCKQLL